MKLKMKDLVDQGNKVGYIMIEALGKCDTKAVQGSFPQDFESNEAWENYEHEISLTFNGIEIDVKAFCETLYENMQSYAVSCAKTMVTEAIGEKLDEIGSQLDELREKAVAVNDVMPWGSIYDIKFKSNDDGI